MPEKAPLRVDCLYPWEVTLLWGRLEVRRLDREVIRFKSTIQSNFLHCDLSDP